MVWIGKLVIVKEDAGMASGVEVEGCRVDDSGKQDSCHMKFRAGWWFKDQPYRFTTS